MKSLSMLFLSLIILAGFSTQAKAETTVQESIQASLKVDYRVGIFSYIPVADTEVTFERDEPFVIKVHFKDTTLTTKLAIKVIESDENNRTLGIQITRQDYRGDSAFGTPNTITFTHELNRGPSVVSIRGQDPKTNGSFRIKLDF